MSLYKYLAGNTANVPLSTIHDTKTIWSPSVNYAWQAPPKVINFKDIEQFQDPITAGICIVFVAIDPEKKLGIHAHLTIITQANHFIRQVQTLIKQSFGNHPKIKIGLFGGAAVGGEYEKKSRLLLQNLKEACKQADLTIVLEDTFKNYGTREVSFDCQKVTVKKKPLKITSASTATISTYNWN